MSDWKKPISQYNDDGLMEQIEWKFCFDKVAGEVPIMI